MLLQTHTSSAPKDDINLLLIGVLIGVTVCMVAITGGAMIIVALVIKRKYKEDDHSHKGVIRQCEYYNIVYPLILIILAYGIRRNRYIEKSVSSPMYQGTALQLTQSASLRNHLPQVVVQPNSIAIPMEHPDNIHDEATITTVFTDSNELSVYPHVRVTSTSSYDTLHRAEATIPDNKTTSNDTENPVSPYEKVCLKQEMNKIYLIIASFLRDSIRIH